MPKITALTAQKRRHDRVNVHVDDQYWKPATINALADHGLHAGMELSEDQLSDLGHALDESLAAQAVVDILSHRARSRSEIAERLARRTDKRSGQPQFSEQAIERALDRMAEHGYVDDAAYARLLCRDSRARSYGRRRAADRLRTAGIDRDLIDEALEDEYPAEAEADVLEPLVARQRIETQADLRRAQARLMRRGFDPGAVRDALAEVGVQPDQRRQRPQRVADRQRLADQVRRRYRHAGSNPAERNKAMAFLSRRGLDFTTARELLDELSD